MGLADEVDGLTTARQEPTPPRGWQPGETVSGDGTLTVTARADTEADATSPDHAKLLREVGRNPDEWMLAPGATQQIRKWNQRAGTDEWCWYYRVSFVPRTQLDRDLDDLIAHIRRQRPRKLAPPRPGGQVWASGDWQVGKAEGEADQALADLRLLPDRFEESWRRSGRPGHIDVAFLGDLGEGCAHMGGGTMFTVRLHQRAQSRIVRDVAYQIIDRAARLATSVRVIAVGGNHGENRSGPKQIATSAGDNRDVADVEAVRWAMSKHDGGRWDHVEWVIPDEDLTATWETEGVRCGAAHGHQFGGVGASAVEKWHDKQAGNHRAIGAADLILSGHFHHLVYHWFGPRRWVQVPCEDAGSSWFAERHGAGMRSDGYGSVTVDLDGGAVGDVRVI